MHVIVQEGSRGPELCVRDEGKGIAEDVRAHIFSEFFTTRPGARGLGLSIVRQHAESFGARLEFESTATGTTMRLVFPTAVPVDAPVSAGMHSSASPAQQANCRGEDSSSRSDPRRRPVFTGARSLRGNRFLRSGERSRRRRPRCQTPSSLSGPFPKT